MLTARDKHRSSSPISLRFCILLAVLGFFALFVFGVDLFEFVSGNLSSECSENNSASSNSNAASNSCQFDLPCGSTIEGGFYRLFDEKTDTDPHANTTTFSLPNNSSALHCAYLCCESNWCNAWNFYVNLKQEAFCVLLKEEENRRATIVNAKQANVGLLFATGHLSGSKNPIFNQSNQETTIPIELLESLRHTIKNPNTEKKMFAKLSQISDELDQLDLALKVCQQNQGNDDAHQTAHDLHSKAEETFNTTLLLDAKHTLLVGGRIHQRGDDGLVVGELATFQLDARDINNQPLSVGGATFLWGRVFSKIPNTFDKVAGIITPRMAFKGIITPIYFRDLKNGSYIGEYIVHEPGEYLVQIGFDGKAVAESPYDLTVSYLETDNLTEKPAKPQCTGSLSQRIKGGYWKNDKFELPFCKPRRYSKEEARQCLAKRNILLLGDSLTRVLFWTMTAFIEGKLLKSHFNGYNCAYNSTRDDYRINFRCGWNSLFTEGFPDPGTVRSGPGYHNGTQARWGIRESIWLGEEARNHAEWWINTKTGEYPDTWIINCGAHDMLLEDRKAFKYNLNELFRALKIGWGKDVVKHIIWMGNSAPVPWKQGKVFEHYKWKQTYAKSLTYDYDARNVASNYDVKFLHSFPLTYPRPELSYDGQHYVLSEDTQQDWVYMEQTQHLINELCQDVLW